MFSFQYNYNPIVCSLLDLENLRLKHIREQKELLEKQKQQLIEQQRKLDEQLTMKIGERNAANAAVSAAEAAKASLSRKQARKNVNIKKMLIIVTGKEGRQRCISCTHNFAFLWTSGKHQASLMPLVFNVHY